MDPYDFSPLHGLPPDFQPEPTWLQLLAVGAVAGSCIVALWMWGGLT